MLSKFRYVSLFAATFTCITLSSPLKSNAQNPVNQFQNVENQSIDYTTVGTQKGKYLVLGRGNPNTVGPYNNNATGNNIPRIDLKLIEPSTLLPVLSKTYCTQAEVNAVIDNVCPTLSVAFYPADAKQTNDGGFIVCGEVRKDMETSGCNAIPDFRTPFLLKLKSDGTVDWFMRYTANFLFSSVVEDPSSGRFLVAGTYDFLSFSPQAFMMCTNATGNVLWSQVTNASLYADPNQAAVTHYTEVTPYTYKTGSTIGYYYAFIGSSISLVSGLAEGDALLTIADINGPIVNGTNVITSYPFGTYIEGAAINDAYDNSLVITGNSLGNNGNTFWSPYVLKIDAMTFTSSFMTAYPNSDSHLLPYSITRKHGGDIYLTGEDRAIGSFLLSLNAAGNIVNYETNLNSSARIGLSITYDQVNNYPAFSGNANFYTNPPTFVSKDMWGLGCDTKPAPSTWPLNYLMYPANDSPILITETRDRAVDFEQSFINNFACGHFKQGTTNIEDIANQNKLTISPNPAYDHLDVHLPVTLIRGNLKIADMTGKIVLSQVVDNTNSVLKLDISKLNMGTYILAVEDGNIKMQTHFLKSAK